MNKPTDLEVNKKLAEYESDTQKTYKCIDGKIKFQDYIELKWHKTDREIYTESLDAQIPILEKLGVRDLRIAFRDLKEISLAWTPFNIFSDGETVQQASAHALYYAILEDEK